MDDQLLRLPSADEGKCKTPMLHNEGQTTRNYTDYNFEVLRDDIYMLGVDSTVTEASHRAHALQLRGDGQFAERQSRLALLHAADDLDGRLTAALASALIIRTRCARRETKMCTDCHVSNEGDNNAWMAQLLMQGTSLVNFMGRYIYVAEGSKGFEAVTVAEHDDPPAVYGSDLQKTGVSG